VPSKSGPLKALSFRFVYLYTNHRSLIEDSVVIDTINLRNSLYYYRTSRQISDKLPALNSKSRFSFILFDVMSVIKSNKPYSNELSEVCRFSYLSDKLAKSKYLPTVIAGDKLNNYFIEHYEEL